MTSPPRQHRQPWHHRARHALSHSLRVRLVAWFVLLALAMAGTFLMGMQYALGIGWRDAARPLVMDYVDTLAYEIGSPPSVERARALTQRLPLSVRISGPVVNWRSHPVDPYIYKPQDSDWEDDNHWDRNKLRFFERSTADGHRIHFGLNLQTWHDRPRFIGWATLGILLALIALTYARVRRMLRPLDDIRAGALRFGSGDFAQPITVKHPNKPDELGELAATINTMGADIHQMLEAKRALLLAISHELRSPLTRARLNTELLPETPEVLPSREALLRDLALMRDLVTDLLETERLASRHAALHREPVDLIALVRDVVGELKTAHTRTDGSGTSDIQVQLPTVLLPLALDPNRMRLLVRNLLDNALRFTPTQGPAPLIRLARDPQGRVQLLVRDFGPGVAPDQLAQLGQPFYRPDSARTREGGGVGLGLYLCRLVAQAHGGRWSVRNAEPGLEVSVDLPVALP